MPKHTIGEQNFCKTNIRKDVELYFERLNQYKGILCDSESCLTETASSSIDPTSLWSLVSNSLCEAAHS